MNKSMAAVGAVGKTIILCSAGAAFWAGGLARLRGRCTGSASIVLLRGGTLLHPFYE